jgi:anti-anti-sigma regulatory factor
MNNDQPTGQEKVAKVRRTRSTPRQEEEAHPEPQPISVERSGDWMPADELREAALAALPHGNGVTLNLDRIDHLDASALQILLALDTELKSQEQTLRLTHVSAHLLKWFEFAGAHEQFSLTGQSAHE